MTRLRYVPRPPAKSRGGIRTVVWRPGTYEDGGEGRGQPSRQRLVGGIRTQQNTLRSIDPEEVCVW